MSGQFQAVLGITPKQGADVRWRFGFALACSCLLHLIVVFHPVYFGGARYASPGGAAGQGLPPLSATLRAVGETVTNRATQPIESEVAKDASPPGITGAEESHGEAPETTENDRLDTDKGAGNKEHILSDKTFFLASQLSTRPKALTNVALDAPEIRFSSFSGAVVFNLWINEAGVVVQASVATTDLPESVSAAIVEAFRKVLFKPGEIGGHAVGSIMTIEAKLQD
jgi:hypothetical protein